MIYTTNVQAQADLSFTHHVKARISVFFKEEKHILVLERGRKHGACGVA